MSTPSIAVAAVPRSARSLDIYQVTLTLIASCRPLSPRLGRFNRRLGAQLTESLASVLQNLAEAMRRTGRDRAHLLTVALGSCDDVRALLEAAVAFGVIGRVEQQRIDGLADRVSAMGYRLRQRCL
ncbi:MAG: four helix bundle protein [Polyangia bacterium]|jgi:four helix bundle protein|nr:four helix bundle protein [Polyangia bacterium]